MLRDVAPRSSRFIVSGCLGAAGLEGSAMGRFEIVADLHGMVSLLGSLAGVAFGMGEGAGL